MAIPPAGERAITRTDAREIVDTVENDVAMHRVLPFDVVRGDVGGEHYNRAHVEELLARLSQEIMLLADQLAFIGQAAQTATQTAVPLDSKLTILREIYEATLGNLPDWWPVFKKEHGIGG